MNKNFSMQSVLCKYCGRRGVILIVVLAFISLLVVVGGFISTMIQNDSMLIHKIEQTEKARFMAEAGVNHALADIRKNGFAARSNFSGALDTGSYDVTYNTIGGRYLISSTGTVGTVSRTVTAEIADNTPTALNYFSGAGNDIKINSLVANAEITGDIHANNDVNLKSGFLISWLTVNGDVSATGIVKEGNRYNTGSGDLWDNHVVINGQANDSATVFEGQDRIIFPAFDYGNYQAAAMDSGDYYASSHVFNNESLSPGNGIVYVNGMATFQGNCTINGGVIADTVLIIGTLNQQKSGDRNIILAMNNDIQVYGRLYTEEALVFAAQDIVSLQIFASLEVNGILLAKRDVNMWNLLTSIDYNYVSVSPSDMTSENGEDTFSLLSWNS